MKGTLVLILSFISLTLAVAGNTQPAMIGQGTGSVAKALHYPSGAKSQKQEAAVQFYCEVGRDGVARHVRILAEDPRGAFRWAVDRAVHQGRFTPAQVDGHAEPVLMGGTVLFVSIKSGPAMIVSLCTAEKQKAASGQNYIQPQMLISYADFTRNCIKFFNSTSYTGGGTPHAEILFNVSATGAATGSRIISENPKGLGEVLIKATQGIRFTPALANGRPVAGEFNFPVDFTMMVYQDEITGSHLGPREE